MDPCQSSINYARHRRKSPFDQISRLRRASLGFDADAQKVRIAQLVQAGTIGAALKAHNNQAIVQIEMIGYSKEQPWLPDDETIAALASLMAVCASEYGIPLEHPWPDGDFGKAGKNPHRSSGKYGNLPGWFGHGDCPSPDTHWDPGNLNWSVVLDMAKQMANDIGRPRSALVGPAAMASEQRSTAAHKKKAPRKLRVQRLARSS
jgi:hypothetical protein